ncbi:MAG: hypothetical protein U9Q73_01250 [Nanoarchaeota archaeon]|nr:hypothetical protein [Nanoarchaeota archaeon]
MNSEDLSIIAVEPFIRRFVFAIIQNIRSQNFSYEEKHVIHADLVPLVSEKVMRSSLKKKEIPSVKEDLKELVIPITKPVVKTHIEPKPVVKTHIEPKHVTKTPIKQMPVLLPPKQFIEKQTLSPPPVLPPRKLPTPISHPLQTQHVSPPIISPKVQIGIESGQDYGRIKPLLDDPMISLIECSGSGEPVMILRAGQKQLTRITLNPEEIKKILEKVSDEAHIPLLEGVFRASVGTFSINAIISDMVGSRFVIRKQTPYSLLERQV